MYHPYYNKKKKTNVNVKYGRVIVDIPYRYLRLIGTITIIYNVCTLAFLLELINIAWHIKGHIGDYLMLILENGYEMVYVLFISAIFGILLNIFVIIVLSQVFIHFHKVFYWLLFASMVATAIILLLIFCLIISMLIYASQMNPDSMDAFYSIMANYSTHGLTKYKIDVLQIELQCCGCRNYTDWYNYIWYDENFVRDEEPDTTVGETPFSCCSIRTIHPCIHHGIQSGFGQYRYTIKSNFSLNSQGCWYVMESRKTKSGLSVAGYLFCQFLLTFIGLIPLRFLQTASNERQGFDQENYIYTGWLWGLYAKTKDTQTEVTETA